MFDVGGVLIDLDVQRCIASFKEDCGMERIEEFLDPCHQKGFIKDLEAGILNEDEFYQAALQYCRPGTTAGQVEESFCSLLAEVREDKVSLVRRLLGEYDLFLLTNNNHITMRRTRAEFARVGIPFETTFKNIFISCDLKLLKPGREIFDEVVRRTGYKAEEILFVDDSMTNVNGGMAAGIPSVFYDIKTSLYDTVMEALRKASSPAGTEQ